MNQLISTDASRVKLIYISWRTTENPKHSSSSCLLVSTRAGDWFIHCSPHLLQPSCQEWIQKCSRAQGSLCSEADRVDGSDLLSGAASMLNEQPLGAGVQGSFLLGVLHGAEWWCLCVTPSLRAQNAKNCGLCLYFQRAVAPPKKTPSLHDAGVTSCSVDLLGRLEELWSTQERPGHRDMSKPVEEVHNHRAQDQALHWTVHQSMHV